MPDDVNYRAHEIRDVKPLSASPDDLLEIEQFYQQLYYEATGGANGGITPKVIWETYDRNLSGLR